MIKISLGRELPTQKARLEAQKKLQHVIDLNASIIHDLGRETIYNPHAEPSSIFDYHAQLCKVTEKELRQVERDYGERYGIKPRVIGEHLYAIELLRRSCVEEIYEKFKEFKNFVSQNKLKDAVLKVKTREFQQAGEGKPLASLPQIEHEFTLNDIMNPKGFDKFIDAVYVPHYRQSAHGNFLTCEVKNEIVKITLHPPKKE